MSTFATLFHSAQLEFIYQIGELEPVDVLMHMARVHQGFPRKRTALPKGLRNTMLIPIEP